LFRYHYKNNKKNNPEKITKTKEYIKNWLKNRTTEKIIKDRIIKKELQKIRYELIKKNNSEQYQKYLERLKIYRNNNEQKSQKNKKDIYKIFNNSCCICGYKKVIQIHHINGGGRKDTKFDKPKNEYVVLCPNCHAEYHKGLLSINELKKHIKN
jgi:hypothetical protein